MPGVCACTCENLMMAKKPEKLHANMKMACRWVLMYELFKDCLESEENKKQGGGD